MKMKLKKGDPIIVVSGKDKGKTGTILHVLPMEGKVVIDGVGMVKKHNRGSNKRTGTITERPRAIDASNVMFVDPKTNKATRIGRKVEGGKLVRVAKKSGTTLS